MKTNKYIYLFVIQGDYGQGWEDVDQSENYKEARENYRLYKSEEPVYAHRMIKRRELNPEWSQSPCETCKDYSACHGHICY